MNFNDPSQWVNHINKKLIDLLNQNTPKHEFKNVIEYSLLPAGKLFRPLLVLNAAKDLNRITEDHLTFAAAIEMHHTYTLIHDDLPAMDDDDERRGRPSCHIKFTEHDAILAGDALLAISFGALSELSSHCQILLKKMYEYTGAQGLILGQVKDLAKENDSIENILEIHELKTARLIQLSLVGSAIICNKQDLINDLEDLGKYMMYEREASKYTKEQIEEFITQIESLPRRGPEPIYWEDVTVGNVTTPPGTDFTWMATGSGDWHGMNWTPVGGVPAVSHQQYSAL